jgi:uncharacterized protein (TIGR03118 family)
MPHNRFKVKNLVSNLLDAKHQDFFLQNSWDLKFDDDYIFVTANGTGKVIRYTLDGKKTALDISLPVVNGDPAPSGLVVNKTPGFVVGTSVKACSRLIIVSENGVVYGYNPLVDLTNAVLAVDNSGIGSVYKAAVLVGNYLYVTDFFNKKVVVMDFNFVTQTTFPFIDGESSNPIPADYSPFGIAHIGDFIYVSYAKQNPITFHDDVAGSGNGYITVYDLNGAFIKRLVSRGHLNSPWALAKAPKTFGEFEDKLLVGNFGDGIINVYSFHGHHLGALKKHGGDIIKIDGLWAITVHSENSKHAYFASGPHLELDGIVGRIKKH